MVINAINIYKNLGINNETGYAQSAIVPKGDTEPNRDSTRANGGVSDNGDTVNVSVGASKLLNLGVKASEDNRDYLQEGDEDSPVSAVSYYSRQMGITEDAVELKSEQNEVRVFSEATEASREKREEEKETVNAASSEKDKEDISTREDNREEIAAKGKEPENGVKTGKTQENAGNIAENKNDAGNIAEKPGKADNKAVVNAQKQQEERRAKAEKAQETVREMTADRAEKAQEKAEKQEDRIENITADLKKADKNADKDQINNERNEIKTAPEAAASEAKEAKEAKEVNAPKEDKNTLAADNREKEDKERYNLQKTAEEKRQDKNLQEGKRFDASLTDKAQEKRAEDTEERIEFQKERNTMGNAGNIYSSDPKDDAYKVVFSFKEDPYEVASTNEEMEEDLLIERLRNQIDEGGMENITVNISAPEENGEETAENAEAAATVNSENTAAAFNTENNEAATSQATLNTINQNAADERVIVQEV